MLAINAKKNLHFVFSFINLYKLWVNWVISLALREHIKLIFFGFHTTVFHQTLKTVKQQAKTSFPEWEVNFTWHVIWPSHLKYLSDSHSLIHLSSQWTFVIGDNLSALWNCATAKLKYCSHLTDRSLLWISSSYHPNHLVDWVYPP